MTINQIKQSLGEQTQNLENKAQDLWNQFSPHYTNLEPYQRGLILIGIVVFLAFAIYYLTHENSQAKVHQKAQAEQAQEEKIIRRMELLKKLRE